MAITIDDFSKTWASTSPLTPYEFSESNYKEGWNFIGGTPPSRQMWDFLQKNNDEKMQYLANNYLPLSGGTMTGAIYHNWNYGSIIKNSDPNSSGGIVINGGYEDANGGQIVLVGENNNNNPGAVFLRPRNSNEYKELIARPDGTLTWDSKDVLLSGGSPFNIVSASVSGAVSANSFVNLDGSFTMPTGYSTTLCFRKIGTNSPSNLTICSFNVWNGNFTIQLFSRSSMTAQVTVDIVVCK